MGIALPQVVTSDRASGAQIIDGSLKFEASKTQYLNRTFSAGNRKTWTWSGWIKKSSFGASKRGLFGHDSTNDHIRLQNNDDGGDSIRIVAPSVFDYILSRKDRDTGWFHLVVACDTTDGTAGDRVKIYHNGVRQTSFYSSSNPGASVDTGFNQAAAHSIGRGGSGGDTAYVDASLSNVYWIDGQALGPESFGYTDPLTNTWRPKKLEGVDLNGTTFTSRVIVHLTYTGGSVSSGVYNAAIGNVTTLGSYSGDTWTATNTGWVETWDLGSAESFTLSSWSVGSYSDQTWYYSNDSSFASGVTGPNSGTIADGTYSTTISSTKYRYLRLQNAPSATYSIVGNNTLTGKLGTNGFYLPMDGNSPIGEDKSGNGNDWTPVNFGGSVALDNPIVSGARPILNTDGGGNVARVGVFGSEVGAYYAVTVSNPGSGNKYYLDGVLSANPTLTRGATYTFDQSDSSNSGHPLVFGTTAEGNNYSDGVTTSGTPGSAGAFTRITVPHNAPDTLYYHCSVHSGMGSSTSQITDETKADPYAWKNVLALPLVGSKDDVSTQILPVINDVTRLRFKTDWNWMYVSAIEINGTILTTGTLDNSGGVWSGGDNWKNGSVGSGNETYSQSARGDWFDVTLASTLNINNLRIYVYLDASAGSTTNIFELELFYGNGTSYLKTLLSNSDAPNGNFNQRSWQDFGSVAFKSVLSTNAIASSASSNFYGGSWYFDGSGDYLDVTESNTDFDFGTGDFTIELFAYLNNSNDLMGTANNSAFLGSNKGGWVIRRFNSGIKFNYQYNSSWVFEQTFGTEAAADRWNHIAITREGNKIRCFSNGVQQGSDYTNTTDITSTEGYCRIGGGYGSTGLLVNGYIQDVRIYKGVAKYTSNFVVPATSPDILPDTPSGVSGSSKLAKVTDGAVSFDGSGDYMDISASSDFAFGTGDFTVEFFMYSNENSLDTYYRRIYMTDGPTGNASGNFQIAIVPTTGTINLWENSGDLNLLGTTNVTNKRWNHIVAARSGTTLKIYVNGIEEASTTYSTSVTANSGSPRLRIGNYNGSSNQGDFDGFISNLRVIKGTALYTANFTPPTRELTNVTNTKLLCCQSNTSAIAAAVSPGTITANGNAAATTFNPFNTDINTVRGQETGYATLNPLSSNGDYTFADGNLKVVDGSGGEHVRAPFGVTSGKWYWEAKFVSQTSANDSSYLAVISDTGVNFGIRNRSADIVYYSSGGGNLGTYSSSNWNVNDTYSLALDLTTNQLKIYTNNILGATVSVTANLEYFASYFRDGSDASFIFNFGQKPFKFPPPAGFQPLNAANVRPETVIARPDHYVGVTTYNGDDQASHIINDLNFSAVPDLVWLKKRTGSGGNQLYDTIRGATKVLQSDSANDEDNQPTGLIDFVRNGFELGSSSVVNGLDGDNGNVPFTYVAWCWKAGGNKNTFNVDDVGYASAAAAGLTAGSVTPTGASVGTKHGFSIIKWTAPNPQDNSATIPHGLTQKPDFWVVKSIDGDRDWITYTQQIDGSLDFMHFNNTDAADNSSATAPTDTTFSVYGDDINTAGEDQIAYLWHSVPGLQKFGKYEGNTTEGAFVELGFRPAIVWIKAADQTWYWNVQDTARSPINPSQGNILRFDTTAEENAASGNNNIDFLSNGFKIRSTTAQSEPTNVNAQTYIYCAWAEAPTFNLYGGQSNAR